MIKIAFFQVNLCAQSALNASITQTYLNAQLELLQIKAEMEEYKRAKVEMDRKAKEAEDSADKEEQKLSHELELLRQRMESAHAVEKD